MLVLLVASFFEALLKQIRRPSLGSFQPALSWGAKVFGICLSILTYHTILYHIILYRTILYHRTTGLCNVTAEHGSRSLKDASQSPACRQITAGSNEVTLNSSYYMGNIPKWASNQDLGLYYTMPYHTILHHMVLAHDVLP